MGIFGVAVPGGNPGDNVVDSSMHWIVFWPAGITFIVSGVMHTFFAKTTAESIGWKTNGFQYEIGFVSFGIGVAGIVAAYMSRDAWIVQTIIVSFFLLLAAANHIREIVKSKNYAPGNTVILIYDIGLPVSMIALLLAGAT